MRRVGRRPRDLTRARPDPGIGGRDGPAAYSRRRPGRHPKRCRHDRPTRSASTTVRHDGPETPTSSSLSPRPPARLAGRGEMKPASGRPVDDGCPNGPVRRKSYRSFCLRRKGGGQRWTAGGAPGGRRTADDWHLAPLGRGANRPRSAIRDPRSAIRDPRSAIRDPRSAIRHPPSPSSPRTAGIPSICSVRGNWVIFRADFVSSGVSRTRCGAGGDAAGAGRPRPWPTRGDGPAGDRTDRA